MLIKSDTIEAGLRLAVHGIASYAFFRRCNFPLHAEKGRLTIRANRDILHITAHALPPAATPHISNRLRINCPNTSLRSSAQLHKVARHA